jgi:hypothetical protein
MTTDQPRPAAASRDDYMLTIDEVAALYERAGHPRIVRTLQRYCAKGHLDCIRQETQFGDRFLVTPASVGRHIAQIEELASASRRDEPRLAAATTAREPSQNMDHDRATSDHVQPRPAAVEAADARYVQTLEGDVVFLRAQISVKDEQIKDLTERARETNHLIAGLQKMLTPLLSRPTDQGESREQGTERRTGDNTISTAGDAA